MRPIRETAPETITDAAGLLTHTYHPASGQLAGEAYSAATTGANHLAGHAIARTFDTKNRRQSLATDLGYGVGYTYDDTGRLYTVGEGFHLAKYTYAPNVSTVETVTIKRAGAERVRHQRTLDDLGRVKQVQTSTGSTIPMRRDHGYSPANQRSRIDHEDTRHWSYDYDDLGQVTSAIKNQGVGDPANGGNDITPLPGYTFGYDFDDIGNRKETTVNARTATYSPTQLNQYENRTIPGAFDVRGEARASAIVTVNGVLSERTDKDFYREVTALNTSAPVNATLSLLGTEGGQTVAETRTAFLAQTPESFDYDNDGNLTQDGQWDYTWDAENRLIKAVTRLDVAQAASLPRQRLTFAYDAHSRRIRKTVESWDASFNSGAGAWLETLDLLFLYDGWNLLTESDANNAGFLVRSHVWGLDLSGTAQAAGGVGGLLWTNTPDHTFAPSSDANGNIASYINTASRAISGRADYGPFGEAVMKTGVFATLPFGFSTKYTDAETDLLYYGFRCYNPSMGRWPNRDTIEEGGGLNLYGMVDNDPINIWDYLGLDFIAIGSRGAIIEGQSWSSHLSIELYSGCAEEGDKFSASKLPQGASMKHSTELSNKAGAYGRYFDARRTLNRRVVTVTQWQAVPISFIVYEEGRANEIYVIYGSNEQDVAAKWNAIMQAARSYAYAEHGNVGNPLRNWPNSKYQLPPGNNSNTFVRTMARVIGKNADAIGGNHPGANSPSPVNDSGSVPIPR